MTDRGVLFSAKGAEFKLGCVSAVDSEGRTIWIADADHDGKRFVVRPDEKLDAFLKLEAAIRACGEQGRLSTPCRKVSGLT